MPGTAAGGGPARWPPSRLAHPSLPPLPLSSPAGLYGLLPPLMAYQLRKKMAQQAQQHEELVPGGTGALAVVFSCAAAIFLSRVAADVGLAGGGSPLETMLALLGPPL